METVIVKPEEIKVICDALKNKEVVAFPTETVFGLGVIFNSQEALERLMTSKNRESHKAITLMLNDVSEVEKYAYVTNRDLKIMKKFMPGKITVVLNKKESVSDEMTLGKSTIGIRIPDSEFVLSLIKETGPLLVTSANISKGANTTTTQEVLAQLDGRISMIVDGHSQSRQASTVVDLSKEDVEILRQGEITLEMMMEVLK